MKYSRARHDYMIWRTLKNVNCIGSSLWIADLWKTTTQILKNYTSYKADISGILLKHWSNNQAIWCKQSFNHKRMPQIWYLNSNCRSSQSQLSYHLFLKVPDINICLFLFPVLNLPHGKTLYLNMLQGLQSLQH